MFIVDFSKFKELRKYIGIISGKIIENMEMYYSTLEAVWEP